MIRFHRPASVSQCERKKRDSRKGKLFFVAFFLPNFLFCTCTRNQNKTTTEKKKKMTTKAARTTKAVLGIRQTGSGLNNNLRGVLRGVPEDSDVASTGAD